MCAFIAIALEAGTSVWPGLAFIHNIYFNLNSLMKKNRRFHWLLYKKKNAIAESISSYC